MAKMKLHTRFGERIDNLFGRYGFAAMLVVVVVISLVMVAVSLEMYNASGAAQVDLSRPGFSSVQQQAGIEDDSEKSFEAQGAIDQKTLQDFKASYDKHVQRIDTETLFVGDALSDESLQVFNESVAPNGAVGE